MRGGDGRGGEGRGWDGRGGEGRGWEEREGEVHLKGTVAHYTITHTLFNQNLMFVRGKINFLA